MQSGCFGTCGLQFGITCRCMTRVEKAFLWFVGFRRKKAQKDDIKCDALDVLKKNVQMMVPLCFSVGTQTCRRRRYLLGVWMGPAESIGTESASLDTCQK